MESTRIPYSRLPQVSRLFQDYLYHYDRVARFFNGPPFDLGSYASVASQLHCDASMREQITAILLAQNQAFGCGEQTLAHIRRLREGDAFAVVTGHQVGIFSGPALTLYKALTVVRLSQWLSEQGLTAVPVFWLAGEDHDLEEVRQVAVLDQDCNLVSLQDAGGVYAGKPPVGFLKLSPAVAEALARLEATLPEGKAREQLLADLRACYQPGNTWAEAFGQFLSRVFRADGLVLIDPLHEPIHHLCRQVCEQALTGAESLRNHLLRRSRDLVSAGYHAQVRVTEDSTLLFVLCDGNRVPLHQRDGHFFLGGAESVSDAELKRWLNQSPLDFSPNVVMRPVVQDVLLPTVAYVAGPSEVAYLAQAQTLYQALGRVMPVVFPRASFTLVDRRAERLLKRYDIGVEDVWHGEERLARKISATVLSEGWSERFDSAKRDLAALLEGLRNDVATLDPTLIATLEHTKEKIEYQMERLRTKVSRAAVQRSELLMRHQQTLLRLLAPGGQLQERVLSGVYFLGRAGYELLHDMRERIQTHSSDHQVVVY